MQVHAESNIKIIDTSFVNGHATNGGAIYFIGGSSGLIANSRFIENSATKKGGAIWAETFHMIKIIDGT